MKLKTTMGTEFGVEIVGYYYREKDAQSYIVYKFTDCKGKEKLLITNGVIIWQRDVPEKIKELRIDPDREHCDVAKIFKHLKNFYPHSAITKYLDAIGA